jgi:hypothetical protein
VRRRIFKRRGEEGVTLEELLFAMMMTGILLFPLLYAMFATTHVVGRATSTMDQSNGASFASSFFPTDVSNAVTVAKNVTDTCGGGTVDLLLTGAPGSNPQFVAYYRSADGRTLYRRTCTGGTAQAPVRLMRNLTGAPIFTCAPTADCTGWTSVTGLLTQSDPAQNNTTPFVTTVRATKRVN